MRIRSALAVLVPICCMLAACQSPPPAEAAKPEPPGHKPAAAPEKPAAAQKTFGAAITEKVSTPLTALVKEPAKYVGQTVRTEGTIAAVCQRAGCWMEISDEAGQAHVKMAGHAFFVPKDSKGKKAVVQAKVLAPDAPAEECSGKDNCRAEAEKATGKKASIQLEASGVELVD